jgi:4-amino-4-deoxy-L-arabinose transferase-like glycosyltransferase
MQKYRGLLNILLLLVLVVGAAIVSVALEDSAPGVAEVIRRVVVIAGVGLVLTIWSEWRESRNKKKQAQVEVHDDAA